MAMETKDAKKRKNKKINLCLWDVAKLSWNITWNNPRKMGEAINY
jgi:hypothetical protein